MEDRINPERMTDTHAYFWNSLYSQWFSRPNLFQDGQGNFYPNAEKYMMMEKAKVFNAMEIYEKMKKTNNARTVKALGREIKNFTDEEWDKHKMKVVLDASLMKFSQNEDLLDLMKEHKDLILVEASPEDAIWGIGLHFDNDDILDESKWLGQNLLGKCLMEAREIMIADGII